jgi:hypothetical protein
MHEFDQYCDPMHHLHFPCATGVFIERLVLYHRLSPCSRTKQNITKAAHRLTVRIFPHCGRRRTHCLAICFADPGYLAPLFRRWSRSESLDDCSAMATASRKRARIGSTVLEAGV